jgi:hypothetical protein
MLLLLAVPLLCGAAALAVLHGVDPLGAVVFGYAPPLLNTLQAGVQRNLSPWLWDEAILPLLEQPSWLVPLSVGAVLLVAGMLRARGA